MKNQKLNKVSQLALLVSLLCSGQVIAQDSVVEPEKESEENTSQEENIIKIIGKVSRYSATKSNTPIMETARSVSIETSDSIKHKGFLTLDDAFTYSAGVYGETFGFATRGDWVRVRGLDVPQYQDSLQSLFGNYNNARPDIYTLEQVEILKGPASVLYGKGSPGGIVNVVSKTPQEESANEVILELGNFNRTQLAFDSTGKLSDDGNWLYRFVGVARNSETQVDHVEDSSLVIAPSISWRPTMETEITFLLNHTDIESDTAAQFLPVYGTHLPAPNGEYIRSSAYAGETEFNKYDTKTTSFTILAFHQMSDSWSLEFTGRTTDGSADYQQSWTSFIGGDRWIYNDDGSLYRDGMVPRSFYRSDATSEQKAIDTRFRGDLEFGDAEHEILMGIQYQDVTTGTAGYYAWAVGFDPVTRQPDATFGDTYWINLLNPTYGNFPPAALTDALYAVNPESNTKVFGIYFSDKISIDNWRIMFGMRYDEVENSTLGQSQEDDALSSSVGVLYRMDNGVSPYISWGQSFEPVVGVNGNGDLLKPQEGEQWETGIKYEPESFVGFMTLAYFEIEQSNLSDPQGLPGGFDQQRGVATFEGIEFEMIADFGEFDWELNFTQLDTTDPDGNRLPSIPEIQGSTWIMYQPETSNWEAGLGLRHIGNRTSGPALNYKIAAVTTADLMVAYNLDDWRLSLNVRNLADKQYMATCLDRGDCFPADGRTVVARASYSF